jgi:putative endonuclease
MVAHLELGARGEHLAARWYRARGYRVLDRNWRSSFGEIDLVVARGDLVVVCEVKTRSSSAYGSPAHAVTPAKQRRLRRLAGAWLVARGPRRRRATVRFDVVAIGADTVEVFPDAF